MILEADLGDWKMGDFKQLTAFVRVAPGGFDRSKLGDSTSRRAEAGLRGTYPSRLPTISPRFRSTSGRKPLTPGATRSASADFFFVAPAL